MACSESSRFNVSSYYFPFSNDYKVYCYVGCPFLSVMNYFISYRSYL